MYRAITWFLLHRKIDINDESQIIEALKECDLDIKTIQDEKKYFVNGHDVSNEIRSVEITSQVSIVAAKPYVRKFLVEIQRRLGKDRNIVCEGRDIGTVVFPHAELKIFLDASPKMRALRRFQELQEKFPDQKNTLNQEVILQQLMERDHIDSSREHSPLLQPKDAVLIDTTNLSIDGVIEKITKLQHERTQS